MKQAAVIGSGLGSTPARLKRARGVLTLVAFFCALLIAGRTAVAADHPLIKERPNDPWAASEGLQPTAQMRQVNPLSTVQRLALPRLKMNQIEQEDAERHANGLPPRYAIAKPVLMTPSTSGTWEPLDAQTMLWRLRIACNGAKSINLGFTRYWMPEGGTLFVYSPDMRHMLRGFTAADNEFHGELWTPLLPVDEVVVEVTIPTKSRNELVLELGSINQGYKSFGTSGDEGRSGACNVDVVCPQGDDWRNEIPSVAAISTGGSIFCTGFMVNNVLNDRTPFFMTANHCGVNAGNAASLVAYWNFENSTCRPVGSSGGAGNGSLSQSNTGAVWLASYSPSDFTLVLLDDMPNPAFGVTYSGWDANPGDYSAAIAIHHPDAQEKRISFEDDPTTTTSYLGEPQPGDGTHVRITDWDLGTTEPGSSGSPLYSPAHRVIGQLHGGFASCTSQTSDWYGRFSVSWNGGGTDSTRLKTWLDPFNTGTLTVETIGNGLTVSPTANVLHLGPVGGPFTNPSVVYHLSNTTGSSLNYSVSLTANFGILLNGGTSPVSGSLSNGASVNVTVTLGAAINGLSQGIYNEFIAFQDTTNLVTYNVNHKVEVGTVGFTTTPADHLVAGGPIGGPFTATKVYTLTSTRPSPISVEVAASSPWISINGVSGPVVINLNGGIGDAQNVTIGYSAAANSLSAGLYNGTVTFTSLSGGSDNTSRNVTLDVGRFTYTASGLPQAIPDATGSPGQLVSTINVTDSYCIGDVDVEIAINHTWVGDLCVTLTHNGTPVALIQRMGAAGACHFSSPFGCDQDNLNIKLDDSGSGGPIESQCTANLTSPPSYVPNQSLAIFNGDFVTGVWTLTVTDNAGADTGQLVSWSLKIASAGSSCPPVANNVNATVPMDVASNVVLNGTSEGMDHVYIITSLPTHGDLFDPNGGMIGAVPYTLLLQGNVVSYDPDNGYSGADSFMYKVNDGQDSNTATVSILVTPPVAPVLLVDDDNNSPDVRSYYTSALDALGVIYEVFNTGGTANPSAADLAGRQLVIWFSGDIFGSTANPLAGPTAVGEAALAVWLEEGNCLFISSQDYLWDMGGTGHNTPTGFMSNYLGVDMSTSDLGFTGTTGQNSLYSGHGPYTFTFPASFSNFSDNINPNGTGVVAFSGPTSTSTIMSMGVYKDGGHWRTTYLGFPLEAIAAQSAREAILQTFIDWCAELDPDPKPPCPADIVPEGGDGFVTIADVTSVLAAFNTPCNGCPQDVVPPGGDGLVTIADVNYILINFGPCPTE